MPRAGYGLRCPDDHFLRDMPYVLPLVVLSSYVLLEAFGTRVPRACVLMIV